MDQETRQGLRKLAAAIREGSQKYDPCIGTLFKTSQGQIVECCALGAALVGKYPEANTETLLKMEADMTNYNPILAEFGLDNIDVRNPALPDYAAPCVLTYAIYQLNDHHMWPREDIANWLAVLSTEGADGG